MNNLCTDVGYHSVLHVGEELCGDHVDVVSQEVGGALVVVLADGLGSGVKASILSTLTAKIISTMMAEGMSLEDCVSTIAATLPVCSERGVAYSTFTIIRVTEDLEAEVIQYDNPRVILLRDGKNCDYDTTERTIGGKSILWSRLSLREDDTFVMMSDGCIHAGIGLAYNFGWERKDVIAFLEPLLPIGYTAKTLATILVDECYRLYGGKPGDDATACVVRIRRRQAVNVLFGPPANRDDANRMMALFFSKGGKHVVCGGTTSTIAAAYLGKPLCPNLQFFDPDIPPTASLEGVDLVTEGAITMNRVLSYAKDSLADNSAYAQWETKRDGASLLARILFEDATDINFFVGRAVNPAHQDPKLPISFRSKMNLVTELTDCLTKMGKRVVISYF